MGSPDMLNALMNLGELFFKLFVFFFPFYSFQVLFSAGASTLCESAISPLVSSTTSINPPIICCNRTHPTLGYLLFAPYTNTAHFWSFLFTKVLHRDQLYTSRLWITVYFLCRLV